MLGKQSKILSEIIRSVYVLMIMAVLSFMLTSCGNNSIQKAKEFIDAGMYEQAIVLLDQEIQQNPKNSEAHMLLGKCKLIKNQYTEAEESFKRATRMKADIGMQIGEVAISTAKVAFNDKQYQHGLKILALAKKYDPKKSEEASLICKKEGDLLVKEGKYREASFLFNNSLSFDTGTKNDIASILFEVLNKEVESGANPSETERIADFCIKLDPSYGNKIAHLYFSFGKKQIHSDNFNLDDAVSIGFSKAIKFDISLAGSSAQELYSFAKQTQKQREAIKALRAAFDIDKKISIKSAELLLEIAQEAYSSRKKHIFKEAYELAKRIHQPIVKSKSDRDRCLNAIYLYDTGMRARAIPLFKELKKSKDSFSINTAKKILSPPAIGKYTVSDSSVRIKNNYDVIITLLTVEVKNDKIIRLHFSLKNPDKKESTLYLYETDDDRGNRLRINDDNGKESLSIQKAFVGGTHLKTGYMGEHIKLKPAEESLVYIDFPMISEGSHSFRFKAAGNYSGWQPSYWLKYSFPSE